MKSAAAIVGTYSVVALIAFGSLLSPILFLTEWSDRLGLPWWRLVALGCAVLSAGALLVTRPWLRSDTFKWFLLVALSMTSAIGVIGLYSDWARHDRIVRFGADQVIEHSFFRSIREAPREHQTFLHSAVLKDCRAYAWSYRTMSLYRLPDRVVRNVVPASWLAKCPDMNPMSTGTGNPAPIERLATVPPG